LLQRVFFYRSIISILLFLIFLFLNNRYFNFLYSNFVAYVVLIILLQWILETKIAIYEIESKIYEISSQVAKKIAEETIKEVLDQYLSKKTKLNENTFQRVKEDVIKIGDKYYKLTPVTIKQKTK
jgi:hypothetical protein